MSVPTMEQYTDLQKKVDALIEQFLPAMVKRLKALEQRMGVMPDHADSVWAQLEDLRTNMNHVYGKLEALAHRPFTEEEAPVKKRSRSALTYASWLAIQEGLKAGKTAYAIGKELGIPNATVRTYIQMPEERVALLKAKTGADSRELFEEQVEKLKVKTPDDAPKTTAPAVASADGSSTRESTEPAPQDESNYIQWPTAYRDAVRDGADPLTFIPHVTTDTLLYVTYMNGYAVCAHAGEIDWRDVMKWKVASDVRAAMR